MSYPNDLICDVYRQEKDAVINRHQITLTGIEDVLKFISEYQRINILYYSSKMRYPPELLNGRKAYSQLSKMYFKNSLSEIGNLINRDHATIIHNNKNVYPEVKKIIKYIEDNYLLPKKIK